MLHSSMRELLPSMGACLPWDPRGHRHLPGHPGTTGLLSLGLNMSEPFSSLTNLDFFLGTPSNHSLDSNRVNRSTESTFTHNGVSSKHHPAVDGLHHLTLHLTACTHERAISRDTLALTPPAYSPKNIISILPRTSDLIFSNQYNAFNSSPRHVTSDQGIAPDLPGPRDRRSYRTRSIRFTMHPNGQLLR